MISHDHCATFHLTRRVPLVMRWFDILEESAFGVLECDTTRLADSLLSPLLPELELKLHVINDTLVAEWLTENGNLFARFEAGKA